MTSADDAWTPEPETPRHAMLEAWLAEHCESLCMDSKIDRRKLVNLLLHSQVLAPDGETVVATIVKSHQAVRLACEQQARKVTDDELARNAAQLLLNIL